eukprot:PhF_6_TR16481/c0_g1_i1/m.25223/K14838/NOP15; nucleolar protein 15
MSKNDADSASQTSSEDSTPQNNLNVVYLGHIPLGFSEQPLKQYVSQFGDVLNLVISRSAKTGRSRGYAFIQFGDTEAAENAVHELHGTILGDRCLEAEIMEPEKVHRNIWKRKNQKLRIEKDRKRRVEGYQPREAVAHRNAADLAAALNRLVQAEEKHNERLEKLGISYRFNGFSKQVGSV